MRATPEDHTMLMFCIKRKDKYVDLAHVQEKVSRDFGRQFSEKETRELLDSLISKGWIEEKNGLFAATEKGREAFEQRWRQVKDELNQDYLKVYRAKRYYPHVMQTLLEFCRDRYVSVFRLFTGRFWLQRKIGNSYITVKSPADVQKHLDVHGIDFIPYIHRIGSDVPDWLVIDFDAGKKVDFSLTKRVVAEAFRILEGYGLAPRIKFSGSRGFQIWTVFQPHELPPDYVPKKLTTERRKRNYFSFYSDMVRFVQFRLSEKLPGLTTSETAKKEQREDKVLLDASIIKPMGDVRAPYSMHVKTGLISVPVGINELEDFSPGQADPEVVAERYEKKGNEFQLQPADGSEFFREVVEWCKLS